jgi:hypothetical protein
LWQFGKFHGYLIYFSRFGTLNQEKSGNPGTWSALHFCPRLIGLQRQVQQVVNHYGLG